MYMPFEVILHYMYVVDNLVLGEEGGGVYRGRYG